jgi:hypothetical protein
MLSLGLITHHPMKTYGGGIIAPYILNLGTRWRCQLHAPAVLTFRNEPTIPNGPLQIIAQLFLGRAASCILTIPTKLSMFPHVNRAGSGKITFKLNLAATI